MKIRGEERRDQGGLLEDRSEEGKVKVGLASAWGEKGRGTQWFWGGRPLREEGEGTSIGAWL